jgi:hypothetical protein
MSSELPFTQDNLNKEGSFASYGSDKSGDGVELQNLVVENGTNDLDGHTNTDKDNNLPTASNHAPHGEFGTGNSTPTQVAINIFISFVGCGMLGMPYAFKKSGWILGIMTLSFMSTLNVYAMLLLVKTRRKLESMGHTEINGYGDVGRIISGYRGEKIVNI